MIHFHKYEFVGYEPYPDYADSIGGAPSFTTNKCRVFRCLICMKEKRK